MSLFDSHDLHAKRGENEKFGVYKSRMKWIKNQVKEHLRGKIVRVKDK